jgi:hypothetical protein
MSLGKAKGNAMLIPFVKERITEAGEGEGKKEGGEANVVICRYCCPSLEEHRISRCLVLSWSK